MKFNIPNEITNSIVTYFHKLGLTPVQQQSPGVREIFINSFIEKTTNLIVNGKYTDFFNVINNMSKDINEKSIICEFIFKNKVISTGNYLLNWDELDVLIKNLKLYHPRISKNIFDKILVDTLENNKKDLYPVIQELIDLSYISNNFYKLTKFTERTFVTTNPNSEVISFYIRNINPKKINFDNNWLVRYGFNISPSDMELLLSKINVISKEVIDISYSMAFEQNLNDQFIKDTSCIWINGVTCFSELSPDELKIVNKNMIELAIHFEKSLLEKNDNEYTLKVKDKDVDLNDIYYSLFERMLATDNECVFFKQLLNYPISKNMLTQIAEAVMEIDWTEIPVDLYKLLINHSNFKDEGLFLYLIDRSNKKEYAEIALSMLESEVNIQAVTKSSEKSKNNVILTLSKSMTVNWNNNIIELKDGLEKDTYNLYVTLSNKLLVKYPELIFNKYDDESIAEKFLDITEFVKRDQSGNLLKHNIKNWKEFFYFKLKEIGLLKIDSRSGLLSRLTNSKGYIIDYNMPENLTVKNVGIKTWKELLHEIEDIELVNRVQKVIEKRNFVIDNEIPVNIDYDLLNATIAYIDYFAEKYVALQQLNKIRSSDRFSQVKVEFDKQLSILENSYKLVLDDYEKAAIDSLMIKNLTLNELIPNKIKV